MMLDPTALVPAMGCPPCGRLVPITRARTPKVERADLNRALRAARRMRIAREGRANAAG